ncbi:MAG: hypothetical protein GX323_04390 [Clostridiales bacterium]|nr:hypothetical protein [Clostridiales bacterium]
MNNEFPKDIQSLINAYEFLVRGIETKAKESEDRSYGGIIRAGKGKLVERAKTLILERRNRRIPLHLKEDGVSCAGL